MSLLSGSCPAPTLGTATTTFAQALQYFSVMQCLVAEDWPSDASVENQEEFDFIIVGAGTAGSVMANRLSEVEQWKVLLVEAGDDPPVEAIVPNLSSRLLKSKYDWSYKTQNNSRTNQALVNGSVNWARGKMLGGTSSLNSMVYCRGNDHDFQKWYDAGNKDWHPQTLHKYFRKAESLQDQKLLKDPKLKEYYGTDGPFVINTFNSTFGPINDGVLSAYNDAGFPNVADLNYAGSFGSGHCRCSAANGQRLSSAVTYLNTINNRKNLKIIKNSLAMQIIFSSDDPKRAVGVEVKRDNNVTTYLAKKEVIVSGGTINTPQLLMLSGIGPKKQLESFNITVKVDAPAVGQNLQDHLAVPVPIFGKDGFVAQTDGSKQNDAISYLHNRSGYLASTGPDIKAFFATDDNALYPRFQIFMIYIPVNTTALVSGVFTGFNYIPATFEPLSALNAEYALYTLFVSMLHPFSNGTIVLQSDDPAVHPIINPNYLEDSRDLKMCAKGIKRMTKVVDTPYFKSIGGFIGRFYWPACDSFKVDSEKYWECVCTDMLISAYHPIGTAKMGSDPATSVVSSRLKVHGVKGLRVVDASVMPSTISGNIVAPILMIAEKASDFIKEEFGVLDI